MINNGASRGTSSGGMKILATIVCLQLFLFSCLLSAASGSRWHLMFYFAADNDLDCYALREISALAASMASLDADGGCEWNRCQAARNKCGAGTTQRATRPCSRNSRKIDRLCCPEANYPKVSVFLDRSASSSQCEEDVGLGPGKSAGELRIHPDGQIEVTIEHEEVNSADPDTLARFLERSLQQPEEDNAELHDMRHFLILWSHGGGWASFGRDDSNQSTGYTIESMMDLQGLTRAISTGLSNSMVPRLDGIGFDACLMSMFEVALALQPFADFLVSSESYGPVQGWDHHALLKSSSDGLEPDQLFEETVEKYMAKVEGRRLPRGVSLAAIDLRLLPSLSNSLQETASAYSQAVRLQPQLAVRVLQRHAAEVETISDPELMASSADLGKSLQQMLALVPLSDRELRTKVKASLVEYSRVIYSFAADEDNVLGCSGLGIYFPKVRRYQYFYELMVKNFPQLRGWAEFVNLLYSSASKWTQESDAEFRITGQPYVKAVETGSGVLLRSWRAKGTISTSDALEAELWGGITKTGGRDTIWVSRTTGSIKENEATATWDGRIFFLAQVIGDADQQQVTVSPVFAHVQGTGRSRQQVKDESRHAQTLRIPVSYGRTCDDETAHAGYLLYQPHMDNITRLSLFVAFEVGESAEYSEVKQSEGGVISTFLYRSVIAVNDMDPGYHQELRELSECYKWGHEGSFSILRSHVMSGSHHVDSGNAMDSLKGPPLTQSIITSDNNGTTAVQHLFGFDFAPFLAVLHAEHQSEVSMMLVARNALGQEARMPAYVGSGNRRVTAEGCVCKASWIHNGDEFQGCANPTNDPSGPWCYTDADEGCDGKNLDGTGQGWGYCIPSRTLLGCSCMQEWIYDGQAYAGTCANPGGEETGSWCVVDKSTCPEPLVAPASEGWDHCQMPTRAGCRCAATWASYNISGHSNGAMQQSGTCLPARPEDPAEGWCMIEQGSCLSSEPAGVSWDWCGPNTPPVTEDGETCLQPGTWPANNSATEAPLQFYGCIDMYPPPEGNNSSLPIHAHGWCFTEGPSTWGRCLSEEAAQACNSELWDACGGKNSTAAGSGECDKTCVRALCKAWRIRSASGSSAAGCHHAEAHNHSLAALNLKDLEQAVLNAESGGCMPSTDDAAIEPPEGIYNSSAAYVDRLCNDALGTECARLLEASCGDGQHCDAGCAAQICKVRSHLTAPPRGSAVPRCNDPRETWLLLRNIEANAQMDCNGIGNGADGRDWKATPTACRGTGHASNASETAARYWECNGETTTTSLSGFIGAQPEQGIRYMPGVSCKWIVDSERPFIKLQLRALATESLYDTVTVFDKLGNKLKTFSGGMRGDDLQEVVTDTGGLIVTFSSDDSIQGEGFLARFSSHKKEPLVGTLEQRMSCESDNATSIGYFEVATAPRLRLNSGASWAITSADKQILAARGGRLSPLLEAALPTSNMTGSPKRAMAKEWNQQPLRQDLLYRQNLCLSSGTYHLHVWPGDQEPDDDVGDDVCLTLFDNGSTCPDTSDLATHIRACRGSHVFRWPLPCNGMLLRSWPEDTPSVPEAPIGVELPDSVSPITEGTTSGALPVSSLTDLPAPPAPNTRESAMTEHHQASTGLEQQMTSSDLPPDGDARNDTMGAGDQVDGAPVPGLVAAIIVTDSKIPEDSGHSNQQDAEDEAAAGFRPEDHKPMNSETADPSQEASQAKKQPKPAEKQPKPSTLPEDADRGHDQAPPTPHLEAPPLLPPPPSGPFSSSTPTAGPAESLHQEDSSTTAGPDDYEPEPTGPPSKNSNLKNPSTSHQSNQTPPQDNHKQSTPTSTSDTSQEEPSRGPQSSSPEEPGAAGPQQQVAQPRQPPLQPFNAGEASPADDISGEGVLILTAHFVLSDLPLSEFHGIATDLRTEIASVLGVSPGLVSVVDVTDLMPTGDDREPFGRASWQSRNLKGLTTAESDSRSSLWVSMNGYQEDAWALLMRVYQQITAPAFSPLLLPPHSTAQRHASTTAYKAVQQDDERRKTSGDKGCPSAPLLQHLLSSEGCGLPDNTATKRGIVQTHRSLLEAGSDDGVKGSLSNERSSETEPSSSSEEEDDYEGHHSPVRTRLQVSLQVLIHSSVIADKPRPPNYAAILRAWMQDTGGLEQALAVLCGDEDVAVSSVEVSEHKARIPGGIDQGGPTAGTGYVQDDPDGKVVSAEDEPDGSGQSDDECNSSIGAWWTCNAAWILWAALAAGLLVLLAAAGLLLASVLGKSCREDKPVESNWQSRWQSKPGGSLRHNR